MGAAWALAGADREAAVSELVTECRGAPAPRYRTATCWSVPSAVDGPSRVGEECETLGRCLSRYLQACDAVRVAHALKRPEGVSWWADLGAGDARASSSSSSSSSSLYIPRSSLYARLRKLEKIAGVDLHSGEERLELHLGIRVLRLAGDASVSADYDAVRLFNGGHGE